jgi:DNA mismatch repair protein MSH5
LLLADFTGVLLTSSCAVKAKELLTAAEVPTELPAVARAHASIDQELYTIANTVASVIDFEASAQGSRLCPGAAKHISVRSGVHAELDAMREEYNAIEPVLTRLALNEKERLATLGLLSPSGGLYLVYVPQLGFLLRLPLPQMHEEQCARLDESYEAAGLAKQFEADNDWYFKSEVCAQLDERYGDISSRLKDVECQLVRHLERRLLTWLPLLRAAQLALAELDALLSLAICARDLRLTSPTLTEDAGTISICACWHPLLATSDVGGASHAPTLVPNDCELGSADERLMLLTGPNASGKTVYLRTVALVVYLAHVGSYVPAESATIARTDAIHTRMHSKESTAINQSAFMLDLSQMANIFRYSTSRSLCLIDEFGKGTNAQDGISLLYASLAELLSRGVACPRVLACTHYTELLEVPGFREQAGLTLWTMQVLLKDRVDTLGAAVEETPTTSTDAIPLSSVLDDDVVFLYKAVRGACTDSFGSHCAAAANVPSTVIQRARHVSRCRLEGRTIERIDIDNDESERKERAIASLVDSFLQYDFHTGTARGFYESVDELMVAVAGSA